MKAFDYRCPDGHVTEHFLSEFVDKVVCGFEGCEKEGEYSPSFWYSSPLQAERRFQNATRFSPVVIHRDAQGNIRFPANVDAPLPPGFHKEELASINDIRRFEREMNQRDAETDLKFRRGKQAMLDGQLAENRRVMEGLVRSFTPAGRKFYEKMKAVSEARRLRGPESKNPAFYLDAFSMDSSNREDYRDSRNDWGKMRGNGR